MLLACLRSLGRLGCLIARLARVEVLAATLLLVVLAAIWPEHSVGWDAGRALSRLALSQRISGSPLLVVAQLALADDPLGRLLRVAAGHTRRVLEGTSLGVGVDCGALLELILLELLGAGLLGGLLLLEARGELGRRLGGELGLLQLVHGVAPQVAHEARLVHLLDELSRQVLAAHEGVARALEGGRGKVAAVAFGGGGGDSHLEWIGVSFGGWITGWLEGYESGVLYLNRVYRRPL